MAELRFWEEFVLYPVPVLSQDAIDNIREAQEAIVGEQVEIVPVDDLNDAVVVLPPSQSFDEVIQRMDKCLGVLKDFGADPQEGREMPSDALWASASHDIHMSDLLQLVELGAVSHRVDDDFGEDMYALASSEFVDIKWSIQAKKPRLALSVQVDNLEKAPKLSLIVALFQQGWRAVDYAQGPCLLDEGERVFVSSMIHRSAKYFLCLCKSDELARGQHKAIHHGKPDGYYRCVLSLSGERMALIHARADFNLLKQRDFEALASGKTVDTIVPRLMLGDDPAAGGGALRALCDGDEHGEEDGEGASNILEQVNIEDPMRPAKCRGYEVKWDFFSHSSGIQRGYVRCRYHRACFRYRQTNLHERKTELVSYLYHWAVLGEHLSREEHVSALCIPDGESVAATEGDVQL